MVSFESGMEQRYGSVNKSLPILHAGIKGTYTLREEDGCRGRR